MSHNPTPPFGMQVCILTQVIQAFTKLLWRSSTNKRDIWVERMFRWNRNYAIPPEEALDQVIRRD